MKIFLIVLGSSFINLILLGCADTNFAKNLQPNDLLFDNTYSIQSGSLQQIEIDLGADKTGFINPDRSSDRTAFEKKYPVQSAKENDYASLTSLDHKIKVGQVLLLSADLDSRTSGSLKNANGDYISISGRFEVNSNETISERALSSGLAGAAVGLTNISSINSQLSRAGLQLSTRGQTAAISASASTGLLSGLIYGAVASQQIQSAINGIVRATNFGERMKYATSSPEMPHSLPLSHNAVWNTEKPIKIADGIVKRIFAYTGELDHTYKKNLFLISVVAVYRGDKYAGDFPSTLGWEYRITNINSIKLGPGVFKPSAFEDAEAYFRAVKTELVANNILL
jgi:hypothetical protein